MRRTTVIVLAAGLVLAGACGKKKPAPESEGKELSKNPVAAMGQLGEAAKKAAEAAKEAEKMTPVDPVPFARLVELLPPAPSGWTAGEPKGESTAAGGFKISQASRHYESAGKRLEVTIVDAAYNGPMYASVTMLAQFSHESTEGYEKGVTFDGNPGVEKFRKEGPHSELTLVVGKRFLVTISGDAAPELVRSVYGSLDRAKLAALK